MGDPGLTICGPSPRQLAATGQPAKHEPFQPLPTGFRHVAFNDLAALEAAIDPTVAAISSLLVAVTLADVLSGAWGAEVGSI